MDKSAPRIERRRGRRVKVEAVAFVFKNRKFHGFYQVENLSENGIALTGRSPIHKSEEVEVLIQFSGRPGVRIDSRVAHCSNGAAHTGYIMGLQFIRNTPKNRKIISDAMQAALGPAETEE